MTKKPKPTERIQLSYPGLLDGQEYVVPAGIKYFRIPDPSFNMVSSLQDNSDEPPSSASVDIPMLEFTRRSYSNIFVRCY